MQMYASVTINIYVHLAFAELIANIFARVAVIVFAITIYTPSLISTIADNLHQAHDRDVRSLSEPTTCTGAEWKKCGIKMGLILSPFR